MTHVVNLVGQEFGRLTVREWAGWYLPARGVRRAQWLCECACGQTVVTQGYLLHRKGVRSCGCKKGRPPSRRAQWSDLASALGYAA